MQEKVFLKMQNISKTFPGVKALDNVQLEVKLGEVHGLVGENGAGKSTLIKILSGVLQPDEGASIIVEGEKVTFSNALDSVKKGISVIYQDFSLFPNLSVAENISISQEIEKGKQRIDWNEVRVKAKEALKTLGVDINIDTQLGKLSVAKQQLVAIARSIAHDAKMIIMDEPTSSLSKGEVQALFKIINNLKEQNISILFVSHKLDELFTITDRLTVLRDGKYIGTEQTSKIGEDKLISMMVGRKVEFKRYQKNKIGKPILEVKGLSKIGNFKDISFTLHEGEVLGITGLVGAGRSEVAQAIFGLNPPESGEIFINGKKVNIRSTSDAVSAGVGYIPENRQTQGLILRKSVSDNITVTILDRLLNKYNLIQSEKKEEVAKKWINKLNIKPPYTNMMVQQLSGGNQQRVVLSKWLANNPAILIVDEPTNGVDVGAKVEIHEILRQLAKEGMGIIVISSELPEVISISDRILVMRRGRIVGEFDPDNVTQEEIMNKALLSSKNGAVS